MLMKEAMPSYTGGFDIDRERTRLHSEAKTGWGSITGGSRGGEFRRSVELLEGGLLGVGVILRLLSVFMS
jgi:hypothetical protein